MVFSDGILILLFIFGVWILFLNGHLFMYKVYFFEPIRPSKIFTSNNDPPKAVTRFIKIIGFIFVVVPLIHFVVAVVGN